MCDIININTYNIAPFLCGLLIIDVGYVKLWNIRKKDNPDNVQIFGIWLMGIIAFLSGIFGQILNMINVFDTIAVSGTISASIVAGGIKNSYKSTIIGLTALIISLIIWGILKGTKAKRITSIN